MRSCSVFAQFRTCTTHKHRSWHVPIADETYELVKCTNPAIDTRLHDKVYKMKSANFRKTTTEWQKHAKTYILCTFGIPKNMSGCCKLLKTFPSWPKDSKTNHLNLSELVCLNSEHDWTNPKDNSVKILWPIQKRNQYRQNYVTVAYVWWIDTQLILGLFSRGLKSQQFSRMWTNGLRQFSWTVWE